MTKRAIVLGALALAACAPAPPRGGAGPSAPAKSAPATSSTASAPSTASAVGSSTAAAPPPTIPAYAIEPFTPDGTKLTAAFAIEGAVMVTDGVRVGRVDGDKVEWVGKIPRVTTSYGENSVYMVSGRYPDRVDAFFETSQGRAPAPTFYPITGKGVSHTEAPGGGGAWLYPARVGETTILATSSSADGHRLVTVRGPWLRRRHLTAKAGCKPGEMDTGGIPVQLEQIPTVEPDAFEATADGTLIAIGPRCRTDKPAAEIWDKTTGASRIVELGHLWPTLDRARLLKSRDGGLWAFGGPYQPVLHFDGSELRPIAMTLSPLEAIYTSPQGDLHARTKDRALHRWSEGRWIAIGRLPDADPARELRDLVLDGGGTMYASRWEANGRALYRLRERERVPAPSEATCRGWFVFLYRVSPKNGPTYTYPTTRKALSTFADASRLRLVEIDRDLGLIVTSKAQGEAVIAHLAQTMKDETPRLFCHAPTEKMREIALDAAP